MASVTNGPIQGSAFRARRFGVWQLQRLGSRYGELPMAALPGAVPATDSAAAPRSHAGPTQRARRNAPKPDPDYERKLEELAQDMLGPAIADDSAAAAPAGRASGSDNASSPAQASRGDSTGPGPAAAKPIDVAAHAAADAAASGTAHRTADAASGIARPPSSTSARSTPRPAEAPRPRVPEVDSRGRREPVLEPLQADDAFHAIRQRHARQRRGRMLAGALVMAVAVGLGSAWWFGKLDQIDAVATLNDQAGRLVARLDRKPATDSSGASGTSDAQAGAEEAAGAPETTSPADAPTALRASPSLQTPQDAPEPAPVVVTPAPAPADSAERSASQNVSKPPVASVDARKKKERNREKTAELRARPEKHKPPQVATAKAGRKATAKPDKGDDDMDRLRSQAYGESSRDREQRMRPTPTPPSPQSAVAVTPISANAEGRVSYKKELAQCEKIDGLFYQERCKWRICKDQWGSHGCPSFPQQSVRF